MTIETTASGWNSDYTLTLISIDGSGGLNLGSITFPGTIGDAIAQGVQGTYTPLAGLGTPSVALGQYIGLIPGQFYSAPIRVTIKV